MKNKTSTRTNIYRIQYWMFHTPSRPVMYIPEYNAVLIPAGARADARPQSMMLKPAQPPRRRRPLVELIKYMQGKTSGAVDDQGFVKFANQDVSEGMNQREHEELLDKMRQLVRMGVVDSIQIINPPNNDEEIIKQDKDEVKKTIVDQLSEKDDKNYGKTNSSKLAYIHQNEKQRSNPIHSQLFQRETKSPVEQSRGYHFSYKYVIPHNHNNVAQVSVQQRSAPLPRQSFINTSPTQVPPVQFIASEKQQRVPFPRVIERKSSVPLQMINLRKAENVREESKTPKERQKDHVTSNSTRNTTTGMTQATPLTNYLSTRPEVQQTINFDKIPQSMAAPKPTSREESLKRKDEHKGLLQSMGLQKEQKKEDDQQEKRVSVKFDHKSGGVSEIKVNTRGKPTPDVDSDAKDVITSPSSPDVPLVQVHTHTRKQTVNIMNSGFDKQTADAMKMGLLMGSVQNEKDQDPDMFPMEDASPRVYLREALPEDGSLGDDMIVVTGKKPSELILRPVARAVAGPKGVAIAAPVAKAYVRGGEEVMLQFEPDSVAIAGPGGRAHSHPRLVVTYMEDKPK